MAKINEKHGGAREGAGRKPKRDEEELKALLNKAWPKSERLAAIKKHAQQAKDGNEKSFQILMAYGYGKPVDRKEITGENGAAIVLKVVYDSK